MAKVTKNLKYYMDALPVINQVRAGVLGSFGVNVDEGEPIDDMRTNNWLMVGDTIYYSEAPLTPAFLPDEYVNEIIDIKRAEGSVLVYFHMGVDNTHNVYWIFDEAREVKQVTSATAASA